MMRLLRVAALSLLLTLAACEDPYHTVKQDRARYASIAALRPLGSICSKSDSASVKRRYAHPLGPTGGWFAAHAKIDYSRTKETTKNDIMRVGSDFVGYVHFKDEGTIQARSYDDIYGEVYCGWSPAKAKYTASDRAVHVSISRCTVGDGGLTQVSEICWFPKEAKDGIVIFSTAHPAAKSSTALHESYSSEHIGQLLHAGGKKRYIFRDRQAEAIFFSLLQAGKTEEIRKLVDTTLVNFNYLQDAIDGATRIPIPAREFHSEAWTTLLLFKAGLELFAPHTLDTIDQIEKIIARGAKFCHCEYTANLLPLYRWAISRLQGKEIGLPKIAKSAKRVHGYNPHFIVSVLQDKTKNEKTLRPGKLSTGGETTYFWLGVREYLAGNRDDAKRFLSKYRTKPNAGQKAFELSATATLLERLEEE